MNAQTENSELIRKYLLGILPEEQSQDLEEQLLTSSDLREELLIVEDELIDDYLCGELSEAEQKQFDTHFLQAPERQQNLRFAKTFERYVADAEIPVTADNGFRTPVTTSVPPHVFAKGSPGLRFALMAVLLLAVLVGIWAVIRFQSSNTVYQSIVVRLEPGRVREGGQISRVSVPAGAGTVQLELVVPNDDYSEYRAVVESSNSTAVWTGGPLPAIKTEGSKHVVCSVPAGLLKHDDYTVTLSGYYTQGSYDEVARYSFRVTD